MTAASSVYTGTLLGTAIGDSLLLPGEGLSGGAIARRFPGPLRHRLLFGCGLVSDDTEHAMLTAQALLAHADDAVRFRQSLAWKLRWWFIALPGGVGLATAKACLRLWVGIPSDHSGVWSAGNGAAMRAAIIGVRFSDEPHQREEFITASTIITHRDPKARIAARAIAETAAWAVRKGSLDELWKILAIDSDPDWNHLIWLIRAAHEHNLTVDLFAVTIGCERAVSGYAYHSVPVAIYAWLHHRGNARAGLEAVFRCGGDVDSIGALTGALFGADGGESAFPSEWLNGIIDRPLSLSVLRHQAHALAAGGRPVQWHWYLQPVRNIIFFITVLTHGLRRLLP